LARTEPTASSGVGVQAHAVAFGVEDLGECPHAWPKFCSGLGDGAAGGSDAREHGIERWVCVEIDDRALSGRLQSGACHEASAGGLIAIVGKNGERGGAHVAAVEGDCENLLVECACTIEVKRRDFEPADGFVHGARMTGCC